jgi:hypothetical protein
VPPYVRAVHGRVISIARSLLFYAHVKRFTGTGIYIYRYGAGIQEFVFLLFRESAFAF